MFTPRNPFTAVRLCLFFSAIFLIALFATAQTTISTGSIVGNVTDPQGAVVSGAKVTITNAGTGQAIGLTTNSAGAYNSGALQPGSYTVQISGAGFRTTTTTVQVQVGNTATANARLQVGRQDQVVEVTGSAVEVNTEQPTVQGVLTSRDIENLPTGSRNFLDLAQLEPGVQIQDGGNFDPTKNGFSSVSFGGRFGRTARIEVDGIDISDETVGTTSQNISAGSISEFQVSQSTLDLSTELTSSGAVNVVSKSGTNNYHGDAFYLFRDKSLMANFPGDQDTYYQRNHFGGSFGGPIVKDKLFFFMNGERIKQGQQVSLAPPAPFTSLPTVYPGGFKDTMLLGKLDWTVSSKMKMFYKFNYEWNGDSRAFGSTYQPFVNRDQTPSHGVGWDFVSGTFTHSVRFGYMKFQNHIADDVLGNPGVFDPAGSVPVDIRIGPAGVVTRFGPSRLAPQATFQGSYQIKYDGSKLSGSHMFRYGVAFNRIRGGGFASFYGLAPEIRTNNDGAAQTAAASGPFPGGAGNPLNYPVTSILLGNGQGFFTESPAFGYPAGGQSDNRLGLYAGDSWKVKPNFTLTYGVRWSRDSGRSDSDLAPLTCDQIDPTLFGYLSDPNDPNSFVPELPCTGSQRVLDQFGGNYGGRVSQPNHNFGPQVGFAWNVGGNGKTVIRAGTGIYYENAVFNNILFDRPGRLPVGLFWGTGAPCTSGAVVLPSGNVTTINGKSITSICNDIVGNVLQDAADMQTLFQQGTAAAGASVNPNFIGENLANGPNSTGNNFVSPNYKTPYSIQMNIGIQQQIRPGMVFTADFLRNVGLHYLLAYDTNHVGDARYLNVKAGNAAITATLTDCGVGSIDAGILGCPGGPDPNTTITTPLSIGDFASRGLDGGKNYLSGFPASLFGLTPDTGAAFAGINPLVGENEMLFPVGRSVYTGLQMKLVQRVNNLFAGVKQANFQVSYALSRFNSMTQDQDFVNSAFDFRDPGHYFGPSSLDRTHQISFGGSFELPHGPRLSFVSHFFSPLANNLAASFQFRSGEGFFSDYLGDGAAAPHIIPGQQLGSWGRDVNSGNINSVIGKYNSNVAGTILPMGQALINAGLFTQTQLQSLGAVADQIDPAPSDEMNMTWLKAFDFRASWPIHLRESVTLEPSIGFYNLFNFANFNAPGHVIGGDFGEITGCQFGTAGGCGGTPGGANGTPLSDRATTNSLRSGTGTGANTTGAPRQIDFGLKLTF
jgi:hypothetical protein